VQGDDARQQDVAAPVADVAQVAQHLAEDEQDEQRLEESLGQEGRQLPPGDYEVASEYGQEGARGGRALVEQGRHRSSRPVRRMKTSSSPSCATSRPVRAMS